MRRYLILAFCGGALLAAALLVHTGTLRVAWGRGEERLNQTAGLVNAGQGDAAAVQKQGCRYDTTPEVVADGDIHATRCDADGDQIIATDAADPLETNLEQLNATDLEGPYDENGGAGNERVIGVSVRTAGAAGASAEGVILRDTNGTALSDGTDDGQLDVDVIDFPDNEPVNVAQLAGTATATGSGVVGAGVLRAVLATDVATLRDTNATALTDGTDDGELDIDVVSAALTEVQGDQVVPQAPTAVACDDTGAIAFTADAADAYLEIANVGTNDVCLRWGTAGVPDRTTLTSCNLVLGAHAGTGDFTVYRTPPLVRLGSEAFECDASVATNLVVTAFRTQ